jgi:hypothetical protein
MTGKEAVRAAVADRKDHLPARPLGVSEGGKIKEVGEALPRAVVPKVNSNM